MRRLSLLVPPADAGRRLDLVIAERGGISRGAARRVLDAGGVFLDGRRCKVFSRGVRPGQRILVNLEERGRAPEPGLGLHPSRLLFSDGYLAVVDKPAGVAAQPTLTTDRGALPELVSALLGAPVLLVHRLDRETSGVTLFAVSRVVASALSEAFRAGRPVKTYLALTARAPKPPEGRIESALAKDPSRPGLRRVAPEGDAAVTRYRTLANGPGGALVEAQPETGRTHQIRVHLAHLGAPLLGDARYGGPRRVGEFAVPRVMLHALRLELSHPLTGASLAFSAPLPADFREAAAALVGPVPLPGPDRASPGPLAPD